MIRSATEATTTDANTTVAISGGGPAGVMLGLLLARAGVRVTVLEKHNDFLRDFRGDTVHPSTQQLLAELGVIDEFQGIVRGRIQQLTMASDTETLLSANLDRLPARLSYRSIALAPQWDLLDLLTRTARRYPTFRLLMGAEALEPIRRGIASPTGGHVGGLHYRLNGTVHELPAVLTVAADGRGSSLRDAAASRLIDLGAPMDVLWFRLPRLDSDTTGLAGRIGRGEMAVAIDRGDYWQVAFLIPKGAYTAVHEQGLQRFRERVALLLPFLADRTAILDDWNDIKLLTVGLNRLQRWSAPGFLAIGDAAHTMSPIGGVGINLAIQDAVATANLLTPTLLRAQSAPGHHHRSLSARYPALVQRRRQFPTVVTQNVQRVAQERVIGRALAASGASVAPLTVPRILRRGLDGGFLSRIAMRLVAYGVRPEHIRTPDAFAARHHATSAGRRKTRC